MLRLRPYKAIDAKMITSWISSEYALKQWGADKYENYPITAEDMNLYYDKQKNNEAIWAMTAFDESGVVGHFTLRFMDEKQEEVRLGFVIVSDKVRGKSYGKELVSLAIRYAFEFVKVKKVSLAVFENNISAISCYESCGFQKIIGKKQEAFPCMGELWESFEMEIEKD